MNRYKHTVLRLVVLLFIISTIATAQDIENRVIEHTLDNGLKILMIERHTAPVVAPYIIFKAGAVDEMSDSRGIAHMLEHMLFKGTPSMNALGIAEAFESIGASGGAKGRRIGLARRR